MRELPITLPSRQEARLRVSPGELPIEDDTVDGKPIFAGRMLRAVASGRVVVERREGSGWRALSSAEIDALPLADFHALRDAAFRLGAIVDRPDPEERLCRNCDAPLHPGRDAFPVAELERWYVEDVHEPPDLAPPFPLGAPVALPAGGRTADTFVMEPVTVREARPLWRALARESGVTPAAVGGLGLRALGEVRDRRAIARALEDAPDEAWATIEAAFLLLNYAPRAHVPYVCPECGALHDLLAPGEREFPADPEAELRLFGAGDPVSEAAVEAAPFPDEDTFAELALRIGSEVYRERGIRNVELVIEGGVPPVDGSGEPLLGSYRPIVEGDAAGYSEHRFQIEVYYRTFRKMYEDAPYDLEDELHETIDHEVEHHLAHLAGRDLVDEHEREEALAELKRTYGERLVRRAQVAGVVGELRTLGWFLLAALVVVGLITAFLWARGSI